MTFFAITAKRIRKAQTRLKTPPRPLKNDSGTLPEIKTKFYYLFLDKFNNL